MHRPSGVGIEMGPELLVYTFCVVWLARILGAPVVLQSLALRFHLLVGVYLLYLLCSTGRRRQTDGRA